MLKLRKNMVVGLMAGLLAFAGVACNGDDAVDPDPGVEDDTLDDGGVEEDTLDDGGAEDDGLDEEDDA